MTNGAEEEEDTGGGLRHLPNRKRDSSLRPWREEWCNADSEGGVKNWQEEKGGEDIKRHGWTLRLKPTWEEMMGISLLLPASHRH